MSAASSADRLPDPAPDSAPYPAKNPAASHADRHDLDKLAQWRDGLAAAAESGFPVFAVFLVTLEDRASHDIFRRYRSAFEDLGAGFSSLVIFGQHGVSSTMRAMLAELGLTMEQVPVLALIAGATSNWAWNGAWNGAWVLPLQRGNPDGGLPDGGLPDGELENSALWAQALARIGRAAPGKMPLDLGGVAGIERRQLRGGDLSSSIQKVLSSLGG